MQEVRRDLRGKAVILMGKNTMMKKTITLHSKENPKLQILLPYLKGTIGLIFTNDDLRVIRDIVNLKKKDAPAKSGTLAQCKVIIPAHNTGMEPTKTSFFQALNIPTRIAKGTVEIINDYKILDEGQKVGTSEAALLKMLKMSPFKYGLIVRHIYDDGAMFTPSVLDISDDEMLDSLQLGISNITGISLGANYPTSATVQSLILNGFKDILSVSLGSNYNFKQAEKVKEFLKDPSKFVTSAPKVEKKRRIQKKEEPKKENSKKKRRF